MDKRYFDIYFTQPQLTWDGQNINIAEFTLQYQDAYLTTYGDVIDWIQRILNVETDIPAQMLNGKNRTLKGNLYNKGVFRYSKRSNQ